MANRIDTDEYFLRMATLVSMRSTCARRATGCILANNRRHVIATGYNGVAAGQDHCKDERLCPGATAEPGSALSECHAIHAEANALLQCTAVHEMFTAYCTDSPCIHCVKLLLNTGCERIVFSRKYPHDESKNLWERSGRLWDYCQLEWPFILNESFYRPSMASATASVITPPNLPSATQPLTPYDPTTPGPGSIIMDPTSECPPSHGM